MFADRRDAGRRLAEALPPLERPFVFGLPRGGVPIAAEVARVLGAPLDVLVVRKLGLPQQPELAMGAVASGGAIVLNEQVLREARVPREVLEEVTRREFEALKEREQLYRGDRPLPDLAGRTAVVVDDGLATGATMRAAVAAARELGPLRVVAAAPVGSRETARAFERERIELVVVETPSPFFAVGEWYVDFRPTSDDEVRDLLRS